MWVLYCLYWYVYFFYISTDESFSQNWGFNKKSWKNSINVISLLETDLFISFRKWKHKIVPKVLLLLWYGHLYNMKTAQNYIKTLKYLKTNNLRILHHVGDISNSKNLNLLNIEMQTF